MMLRVGDLDKSIQYYTEALGMKVLRRKDNESQKYTLAFLGYGGDDDNVAIELTCGSGGRDAGLRLQDRAYECGVWCPAHPLEQSSTFG